jgi:hypothetical protein
MQFGTICRVHDGGLVDIVLYSRDGEAVGRESPPEWGRFGVRLGWQTVQSFSAPR